MGNPPTHLFSFLANDVLVPRELGPPPALHCTENFRGWEDAEAEMEVQPPVGGRQDVHCSQRLTKCPITLPAPDLLGALTISVWPWTSD